MYTTILTLHKQGKSQRQIAKITNTHRRTINKIITNYQTQQIEGPTPYNRKSQMADWHEQVVQLLGKNLSNVRIFEELKEQGCKSSYSTLSRYVRQHNIRKETCIRFHTMPGEEAQVDFGAIGKHYDPNGKLRTAYIFNMRLSYSRLDYYEVVFDQKIATWINCHMNAFNYFGGVPQTIKLDNLKAGVVDANFYEPIFQKEYQRMAKHYGCWLSPCRPYQPQEKGKVESGVKYIKNNFFAGRAFNNYQELSAKLNRWVVTANDRIHGTTKCQPRDLFSRDEASKLIQLPPEPLSLEAWLLRIVAKDCHVTVDHNYYSVPAKYVTKEVAVSLSSELVKIYIADELITTHPRAKGLGIFSTNISHYSERQQYSPGFAKHDEHYKSNLANIGKHCAQMLSYIEQTHKKDWHRTAKGILSLRKLYSDELIDKACARALHYGIISYRKIRNILESNSYNLPLNEGRLEANDARTA